jgi:hypothetical protein
MVREIGRCGGPCFYFKFLNPKIVQGTISMEKINYLPPIYGKKKI